MMWVDITCIYHLLFLHFASGLYTERISYTFILFAVFIQEDKLCMFDIVTTLDNTTMLILTKTDIMTMTLRQSSGQAVRMLRYAIATMDDLILLNQFTP